MVVGQPCAAHPIAQPHLTNRAPGNRPRSVELWAHVTFCEANAAPTIAAASSMAVVSRAGQWVDRRSWPGRVRGALVLFAAEDSAVILRIVEGEVRPGGLFF